MPGIAPHGAPCGPTRHRPSEGVNIIQINSKLLVSDRARDDLTNIAEYTEQRWGGEQKEIYLGLIEQRFADIRRNPEIGAPRDHIKPGYRSVAAGRHLIFYRLSGDAIGIVRVLHQNMDVRHRLAD